MKKLVLFGDSLIKNLNRAACEKLGAATITDVYNCAVGGWDTNDGVAKAPYIAQLKPDFVVFSFGTNDSAPWRQLHTDSVLRNIDKLIQIFSGSKIVFFLPPPVNEETQDPHRARSNKAIQEYAEVIRALLLEKNVTFIDSWDVFKKLMDKGRDYHEEDGVHFNDLGYETLTKEIVEAIVSR